MLRSNSALQIMSAASVHVCSTISTVSPLFARSPHSAIFVSMALRKYGMYSANISGWNAGCCGMRIFCQSTPSFVIIDLPKIGFNPSKYLT